MMNECFITITIVWLLLYKVLLPKDRRGGVMTTPTAAIQFHHLMSLQVCHLLQKPLFALTKLQHANAITKD